MLKKREEKSDKFVIVSSVCVVNINELLRGNSEGKVAAGKIHSIFGRFLLVLLS